MAGLFLVLHAREGSFIAAVRCRGTPFARRGIEMLFRHASSACLATCFSMNSCINTYTGRSFQPGAYVCFMRMHPCTGCSGGECSVVCSASERNVVV